MRYCQFSVEGNVQILKWKWDIAKAMDIDAKAPSRNIVHIPSYLFIM